MNNETKKELITLWRNSKKDRMQMKIMSQLADCSEEEIENLLRENGFDYPEVHRRPAQQRAARITAKDITDLLDIKIKYLNEKILKLEIENKRLTEDLNAAYQFIAKI